MSRDDRDVRSGGSWTLAQRRKNDAIWIAVSLAIAIARHLSPALLRAIGRGFGLAAHGLFAGARRTARDNVARAFPDLGEHARHDLVRRSFVLLGGLLGDATAGLEEDGSGGGLEVSDEARAILTEALREGRGVVFPSAHLGPWERVAASLVGAGVPLTTLARESYDARLSRLYVRLRERHGVGVIWRSGPGAAARILRTLRAGRVLGVPMDLRSRVPSCDAPFLGHDAPTPIGPARIALRTGSPVVVGTAAPHPSGDVGPRRGAAASRPWVVTATRIRTDDLGPGSGAAIELTARINEELSRRIRAMPEAWVWMHERWPGGRGGRGGTAGRGGTRGLQNAAPKRGMMRV